MKIKLLAIIIFFSLSANAQLSVSITSSHGTDTAKTCEDTTIRFIATVKYNGDTIDDAFVYWNFDDGTFESDTGLDTIEHVFLKNGGYRVLATVKKENNYAFDIFEVQIGMKPDFKDVKTSLEEDEGLCSGDKVILTGAAAENKFEEKRSNSRLETFPVFIDYEHDYISSLIFRNYPTNKIITNAGDLDSVGIYLEHSDAKSLRIKLICPNGKQVILKDYGGNASYLGDPVSIPGDYSEGQGFWYFWSINNDFGTMNNYTANDTLPQGVYAPEESFDSLQGCPLDGIWYISVEDSANNDNNGYAFGWKLFFDDTIKQDTLIFSNIYDLNFSAWLGDKVNVTSNAIADAYPEEEGQHKYYFYVRDDYGCMHDTSVTVEVEKAHFETDKYSLFIGDSIHVTDKTSWSKEWEWDFDDDSDIGTEKDMYHKYFEKDTFLVKMTVYSESGCTDFDTAKIIVNPKPIEITDYNIFTPNGDGVNDVFSFFNTPDEKIIAANIETIKGRIYNRYGETVCTWNTPEEAIKGWDGTINNDGWRKASPGFYYYIIIIKGKDGKKYEPFFGIIYLYRDK